MHAMKCSSGKRCRSSSTHIPVSEFIAKHKFKLYKTCMSCRIYNVQRAAKRGNRRVDINNNTDCVDPCVYCGKRIPWGMEYHHRNPEEKSGKVTSMRGMKRIREIAKCDLICSLCHCELTEKQNNERIKANVKTKGFRNAYIRNHDLVKRTKIYDARCTECNLHIEDTGCLFSYFEYDHMEPSDKRASISRMCSQRVSLATLKFELMKCVMRCRPCHRKKSAFDACLQ